MPALASIDQPSARTRASGAYTEYSSSAVLRQFVDCFWSRSSSAGREPDAASRAHRVLPDGCVDIVIAMGGSVDAIAVGTMTRSLLFASAADACFIGVRFRPGAAGLFLGVPASALTDLRVSLAEVWPDTAAVIDAVADAGHPHARARALEHALVGRLRAERLHHARAPRAEVNAAVRIIERAEGNLSISALAPVLGVTRQHLARRFTEQVGVGPKVFARVTRVRRAIDQARTAARNAERSSAMTRGPQRMERGVDWSALANGLGYYDQSHFVDDFKAIVGLTPARWLAQER